jgi:hypothetical protein
MQSCTARGISLSGHQEAFFFKTERESKCRGEVVSSDWVSQRGEGKGGEVVSSHWVSRRGGGERGEGS